MKNSESLNRIAQLASRYRPSLRAVLPLMILSASLCAPTAGASTVKTYSWQHFTVGAHETMTFNVRYRGGEWGDADVVPDRSSASNYDDLELRVYGDYGWTTVLEAKDLTHVKPQCRWWVGYIYDKGLDYVIKVTNNESHDVGFQIHVY